VLWRRRRRRCKLCSTFLKSTVFFPRMTPIDIRPSHPTDLHAKFCHRTLCLNPSLSCDDAKATLMTVFFIVYVMRFVRLIIIITARCTIVQSVVLRLHVIRPSVTLVFQDHTGRKYWKPIARTIIPTCSLFVAQRPSTYSQGNTGKFWGDSSWGGKKWHAGAQKR